MWRPVFRVLAVAVVVWLRRVLGQCLDELVDRVEALDDGRIDGLEAIALEHGGDFAEQ
jgi:hypothetical protein